MFKTYFMKLLSFTGQPLILVMVIALMILPFSCTEPSTDNNTGKELLSGERIPVSLPDQTGPLSIGVSSIPVGRASVFEGKEPDLFVMTGKHNLDPETGLYLFKWIRRDDKGVPVFGERVRVNLPENVGLSERPSGTVFQTEDGKIYGFWLSGNKIYKTVFNKEQLRFDLTSVVGIELLNLPEPPAIAVNFTILQHPQHKAQVILNVNSGLRFKPEGSSRSPEFHMYDGAGVFLGNWNYEYLIASDTFSLDKVTSVAFRQFTPTKKEILMGFVRLTPVRLKRGENEQLIAGSWFGNILFYPVPDMESSGNQQLIADDRGIALRHPAVGASPVSYPNKRNAILSDLIVGGEGALYYYEFSGKYTGNGAPVYNAPKPVGEQDAKIYTGSLPVVNVIDWDNNGALDIVTGNSEGRVLVFYNRGSNDKPAFETGTPLSAGSRPIHLQPGYAGSVQGPGEARWGYSCPTVADWNEDGLPDMLMNSALGIHEVYLNVGKPGKPLLEMPNPVYCSGLDLHGTWRVQAGVKEMGGKMAYVTLDDDDEFHLYWKIDLHNVKDGGKLHLDDGSVIRANYLHAGGTGRLKIVLTDWDKDGKTDMLVGTPRHASVPNPGNGLPRTKGYKGAAVLFMKNVGSDTNPLFAFPKLMRFKGEPIYLGQHTCSPAVWDYGQSGGADLLVGEQDGRIRFYARKDLSTD